MTFYIIVYSDFIGENYSKRIFLSNDSLPSIVEDISIRMFIDCIKKNGLVHLHKN
jgi:hypothetical protein